MDALHGSFDHLLCMTVNPGWGGQKWIPESNARIDALRSLLPGDVPIQVDGGVDADTAAPAVTSGAAPAGGRLVGVRCRGSRGQPTRAWHTPPVPGSLRRSSQGSHTHRLGRRQQMNRSRVAVLVALAALFALPATAVAGHNLSRTLDHAGQPIQLEAPPSNAFTSGGPAPSGSC